MSGQPAYPPTDRMVDILERAYGTRDYQQAKQRGGWDE